MSLENGLKFEFYVLNYNFNRNKCEMYNVFNNILLQEAAEKEVRKYIRNPNKYIYKKFNGDEYKGFEGLCKNIQSLIMWQEWSRSEYEIGVTSPHEWKDSNIEKWDCYQQCVPNVPIIARECIYQYKQYLKNKKDNKQ